MQGSVITGTTSDWYGNVPENLLALALNKPLPIRIPNADGKPLVAVGEHLDDFVEDVKEPEEDPDKNDLKLVIGDVAEADRLGHLYIPLNERVDEVDQLVGTRTLVLAHKENNAKLAGLVRAIMETHQTTEKKAKQEAQDSVDIALMKKMPKLKDDRSIPILKARVKNSDGDPVIVKIRALMPGDNPDLAQKMATVTAQRNGLPEKAIPKLTKHLLAFSTKKTNYSAKVGVSVD